MANRLWIDLVIDTRAGADFGKPRGSGHRYTIADAIATRFVLCTLVGISVVLA